MGPDGEPRATSSTGFSGSGCFSGSWWPPYPLWMAAKATGFQVRGREGTTVCVPESEARQ